MTHFSCPPRSGIPLVLDMMPTFWRCLDPAARVGGDDLRECDPVTDNFLREVMAVPDAEAFEIFLEEQQGRRMTERSKKTVLYFYIRLSH